MFEVRFEQRLNVDKVSSNCGTHFKCVHFQQQKCHNSSVNFMVLAGIHLEHLMARLDKAAV